MRHSIRLAAVAVLFAFASFAHAQNANLLWYDKPATDWEKEALPIGNGRIGAMVFGGVDSERLQIAEKSLWTGGPGTEGGYDFGLPADSQAELMRSIGKQLTEGAQLKPEDVGEAARPQDAQLRRLPELRRSHHRARNRRHARDRLSPRARSRYRHRAREVQAGRRRVIAASTSSRIPTRCWWRAGTAPACRSCA